jgi:hypothetical protein
MELELLQKKWAEQDRKLDLSIRLNQQLLLTTKLNRVRSPLLRFAFATAIGALVGVYGNFILANFIYHHWAQPRFALPAILLHVWLIASLAASIRQMMLALQIDYDQPVAVIQKQLESLRQLRIRITKWTLLTGQVVWWIPCLVVSLKGFLGLDAYKILSPTFLATNLAFGLAIIPLAIWVSNRWAERMSSSPFLQQLMREVGGYNLNLAASRLATLHEFETE